MAKINLTPKKIYEQEFKTSMRGYDKTEVDEFLDDVIKDYGVYIALVKELQEENAKLKAKETSAPARPLTNCRKLARSTLQDWKKFAAVK